MENSVQEYLDRNTVMTHRAAGNGLSEASEYRSSIDNSYVGLVGFSEEDNKSLFEFFIDHGITELQNADGNEDHTANIGFSEKEQKWYGWSHRAICGFGIGSEVKRGDCAYMATDKEDFLQDMVRFWNEPDHLHVAGRHGKHEDQGEGVFIDWIVSDKVQNKSMRGKISGCFHAYPSQFGRGEWKAECLEDARQMACDFAESVA